MMIYYCTFPPYYVTHVIIFYTNPLFYHVLLNIIIFTYLAYNTMTCLTICKFLHDYKIYRNVMGCNESNLAIIFKVDKRYKIMWWSNENKDDLEQKKKWTQVSSKIDDHFLDECDLCLLYWSWLIFTSFQTKLINNLYLISKPISTKIFK